MEGLFDIQRIQEVLPQRYPFLLVDRVIDVDKQKGVIVCIKNVTINDYFFVGHFPDKPIMPGVLIIEALAQASILLYAQLKPENARKKPDYLLGKVDAKFMKMVKAGDQLVLEVHKQKILDTAGIVHAFAKVDNAVVTEAKITFGVQLGK